MLEAIPRSREHQRDFDEFDRGLRQERPNDVKKWERMLETWEGDHSAPCPYTSSSTGTFVIFLTSFITISNSDGVAESIPDLKLALAEEEQSRVDRGEALPNELGPSNFIWLGLEIESDQFVRFTCMRCLDIG